MKSKGRRCCLCVLLAVAALVVGIGMASSSVSNADQSDWCLDESDLLCESLSSSSSSSSENNNTKKKKDALGWEGSFIQQLLFFSPPLTDFDDIWKVLVIWNLLGFALIYLACGIVAGSVFKNHNLAIVIPLISAIVGSIAGFFCGAILSVCVAFIYISGPFEMYWYMGLIWGLGMPIAYTLHSFIRFVFN